MLIFNNTAMVQLVKGRDLYGQPKFGKAASIPCAVVKMHRSVTKTGVRTDATASRGAAEETTESAKVLFPADARIVADTRVTLAGFELRVIDVQPRYDVPGRLDHLECLLDLWSGKASS